MPFERLTASRLSAADRDRRLTFATSRELRQELDKSVELRIQEEERKKAEERARRHRNQAIALRAGLGGAGALIAAPFAASAGLIGGAGSFGVGQGLSTALGTLGLAGLGAASGASAAAFGGRNVVGTGLNTALQALDAMPISVADLISGKVDKAGLFDLEREAGMHATPAVGSPASKPAFGAGEITGPVTHSQPAAGGPFSKAAVPSANELPAVTQLTPNKQSLFAVTGRSAV